MGREADCEAAFSWLHADAFVVGKAYLESDLMSFRGQHRLKIALNNVVTTRVEDGTLIIVSGEGTSRWVLGSREATLWAKKIASPPTTLDKLGIKAESEVWVFGTLPESLRDELETLSPARLHPLQPLSSMSLASPLGGVLLVTVNTRDDLELVAALEREMLDDAALWVVFARGLRTLSEGHVRAAGLAAGLTDNKTAKISATMTSLRFVRPKLARASGRVSARR
jgi:hypothetical protein